MTNQDWFQLLKQSWLIIGGSHPSWCIPYLYSLSGLHGFENEKRCFFLRTVHTTLIRNPISDIRYPHPYVSHKYVKNPGQPIYFPRLLTGLCLIFLSRWWWGRCNWLAPRRSQLRNTHLWTNATTTLNGVFMQLTQIVRMYPNNVMPFILDGRRSLPFRY